MSVEDVVARLLTEMDLPVSAPAWTPQQAVTFLEKLEAEGFLMVRREDAE